MFASEFDEVPAIAVHAYPPSVMNTTFPVKSVDDLNGKKIAVLGKEGAEIVSRLGATPLSIGLFSFYQSIQKGMVEGASISYTAFYPFKLQEVVNYHFELNMGGSNAYIGVGKTTWDGLPANVRKTIQEQSGESFSRALGKFWDGVANDTRGAVGKMPGHHIVEPTAADAAKVERLMAPMLEQWVAETPGADAIIKAFRAEYQGLLKARTTN
jgi:TRAP-type C4-dicarboxylate transport system substrate-binding protein